MPRVPELESVFNLDSGEQTVTLERGRENKTKQNNSLLISTAESDGYRNCNSKMAQTLGALL